MRREEGWFVCDTGSHAGTRVRNKQITEPTLVQIGDKIRMGSTTLTLRNASDVPAEKAQHVHRLFQRGGVPL